jgi:hypothetical protein
VDEQETNKPIRQTVVLIDKDQLPLGKLRTLSPLMNNVQKFGREVSNALFAENNKCTYNYPENWHSPTP